MDFGKNLKELREKRGLKQKDVANDLYITVQMLSAIETGIRQPSLSLALALARYFNTTVETIAGTKSRGED